MNNIATLIFSKNRPLQLDLLLNSFYLNCMQPDSTDIYVIYTCDQEYKKSYSQLIKEQGKKRRSNIRFIYEKNFVSFKMSFINIIKKYEYIMFLVDDNIFTNNFDLSQIKNLLQYNLDAIGFSLRLGKNTKICYPLNTEQNIPENVDYGDTINIDNLNDGLEKLSSKINSNIFAFDWTKAEFDFNYPLEVSSSIYRMKDLDSSLQNFEYNNPNNLESVLYFHLWQFLNKKPKLLSYQVSVAFCAPMNKVQNVAVNNRFSNMNMFSEKSMLTMYKNGFRIDPIKFEGFVSNGCHQEVALYTMEEFEKYAL